ncbi:hypothetical protein AB5N19_12413 [Seiridium cardinale]|uniref:Uncharacterized protein n=1 Tax=Seiridium cardinale TaxID=138064 RepID=A0ABR2XTX5_9PEZI
MSSTDSEPERSPTQLSESSSSSLDSAQIEVEQILDHLTRITLVIRKSGTSFRFQKADRLFKPGDHNGQRHHLTMKLLVWPSRGGRGHWLVDTDHLTPIQERLVEANLRRRNRFRYAQRHAQKLALDADRVKGKCGIPQLDNPMPMNAVTPFQRTRNLVVLTGANAPNEDATHCPIVLSATTASAVGTQIQDLPRQMPTPSQLAKTAITAIAAHVKYPRPPRLREGLRYFQCPCCCKDLPELFHQQTQWKYVWILFLMSQSPPPRLSRAHVT